MKKIEEMKSEMMISKITKFLATKMEAEISILSVSLPVGTFYNRDQPGTLLEMIKVIALAHCEDGDCRFKVNVLWNCNYGEFKEIFGFEIVKD